MKVHTSLHPSATLNRLLPRATSVPGQLRKLTISQNRFLPLRHFAPVHLPLLHSLDLLSRLSFFRLDTLAHRKSTSYLQIPSNTTPRSLRLSLSLNSPTSRNLKILDLSLPCPTIPRSTNLDRHCIEHCHRAIICLHDL